MAMGLYLKNMHTRLLDYILHRPPETNKYNFGHVLVFGGSAGMVGAPLLSGKAALRIGAGLVTIATDKETADKLDRRAEEIMTLALPGYDDIAKVTDVLLSLVQGRKVKAVVIGPGLKPETTGIVRSFAAALSVPIVLDAGGLAAFYGHLSQLEVLTRKNPQIIITPHTGEYTKLTGASGTASELTTHALQFAKDYWLTLVLKGHHTLVAHPEGVHYANTTGNPGMATAGTGDVLVGVIAGLLAQGISTIQAAEIGVYLHGLAGDLATQAKTEPGMIASDVIEFLPAALKKAAESAAK